MPLLLLAAVLTTTPLARADALPPCLGVNDARKGRLQSEVRSELSRRAIEIIERAKAAKWKDDDRLRELVVPSATFFIMFGEVGLPLPSGPTGARHLAENIEADRYRFYGWDDLDGPADACAKHKIEVEFSESYGGRSWTVEFQFERGRVVAATTSERSVTTGLLSGAENKK